MALLTNIVTCDICDEELEPNAEFRVRNVPHRGRTVECDPCIEQQWMNYQEGMVE